MKRSLLAAAVVLATALGMAGPSIAQTGVQQGPVGSSITPQQRALIKQYVVQERVAPVTVNERIAVGAKLPADVELRSVPADWGPSVTKYRYIYSDNHVYFVEPSSREVVSVIE